ncbi:hypothetical protein [Mycolicibacterium phlei]|uniref:hypothetical protein n=1 Tax=Mycolicibacterium phlei TaxID=1771 RepID=UPI00025AEB2B|nr:hypothetical protein [Mycolicibacterium phlei]EID16915.1 hypothetical protein MPHLEI_05337 [Mycolicibacterium phlei RIVM601174]MBF4190848.1 hypothetical protein [Mycolicibacterium phlei]
MSTLRAILELQGSLDRAVIETRDPRVAEIVDRFFPGSAANAGWYSELKAFLFPDGVPAGPDSGGQAPTGPDPVHALQELFSDAPDTGGAAGIAPTPSAPPLTAPEASRLMYALGAVVHLTRNAPADVELPFADPTAPQPRLQGLTDSAPGGSPVDRLLELVAPERGGGFPTLDATHTAAPTGADLGELFATRLTGWQDWPTVTESLAGGAFLRSDIAAVPLCVPSVITVDGIESVVVDTEFTSTEVSLNQLKAVVDPNNWDDNYPDFFRSMDYRGLRPDSWRRVLETVGLAGSRQLVTKLKYLKTTVSPTEARLDYDLCDPAPDPEGDGVITVDRGFINMWAPQGDPTVPPVTVRTRKVAHITGLRPYTMARFVCIFGYGNAAVEMLCGNACKDPLPPGLRPWEDPADEQPSAGATTMAAASKPHPQNSVASTTITMLAQCFEEVTASQFDLADKWMSGKLTLDELAKHSADVTARIAGEPFRIMAAIAKGKGPGK